MTELKKNNLKLTHLAAPLPKVGGRVAAGRFFCQSGRDGMNTLRLFTAKDFSIPAGTSWYLADLGEFRGKQELYT